MKINAAIGPLFAAELAAAGLGDGIAWDASGVMIADDYPAASRKRLSAVIAAHDPAATVPAPIVIAKIDLWRRMTDAEHDQMMTALRQQSTRLQDIFDAADTFRSDAPEWGLLRGMAVTLYGPERAAVLLTP